MVYVTHYGDDGSACHQVVLVILLFGDGVLYLGADVFSGEAELVGHDVDGLCIQTLVDGHHDADGHTGADDLVDTDVHHRCQLRDGHKLR